MGFCFIQIDEYWEKFERKGERMKRIILVLLAMVMLGGCMTYNEKMLRKVDIPKQQNPQVIVEIRKGDFVETLNGNPLRQGTSTRAVLNEVVDTMMNRWKDKGLIADFGPAEKWTKKPDFTLFISGARHEEGSEFLATLCGTTLGIIPASSKLIYELGVILANNKTQRLYLVKVKNGATMWMQIIFLPLFPISKKGIHEMMIDMADYAYDELRQQGAFDVYLQTFLDTFAQNEFAR
jgi:hypothetical protein